MLLCTAGSYFLLEFFLRYLKKSVGDGAIKMHFKNVRIQTESRVTADTMHLAQPVVPLHSKSLSRKILQQCHDTEEDLQVMFQLSS